MPKKINELNPLILSVSFILYIIFFDKDIFCLNLNCFVTFYSFLHYIFRELCNFVDKINNFAFSVDTNGSINKIFFTIY